ncbi:hypothetical protein [Amycolatopsis sp.]|uniref:hypothetical protein n=1 Tax=Amycolatopsis sp. TaxID=37632 RepID=UPI002CD3392E|nr:hypothetical protein [Amycolatopsis sp.]HVV14476.1 hypothetical protein [Amycolatopsis sp.]
MPTETVPAPPFTEPGIPLPTTTSAEPTTSPGTTPTEPVPEPVPTPGCQLDGLLGPVLCAVLGLLG